MSAGGRLRVLGDPVCTEHWEKKHFSKPASKEPSLCAVFREGGGFSLGFGNLESILKEPLTHRKCAKTRHRTLCSEV